MIRTALLLPLVVLAACTLRAPDPAMPQTGDPTRPQARPAAVPEPVRAPPAGARTVEEFDVTTPEERATAAAADAGGRLLGTTIASLGDPARAGFWLETPLVDAPGAGRVVLPSTGQAAQVELIPITGPQTAGSRLSLAAMRLIGASLTDLPTIEVYSGG